MASTPPQTAAPRRPVHAVTVVAAEQVTPNMRRLTFAGEALTGMAAPLPAQWLRVIAPGPDGETRVNRAYTIRKLEAGRGALDIDFVLHGEAGPVSAWASRAGVGHAAQLGTPRGGHRIDLAAPWRLFAGDETALPAIATMLEAVPVGDVPTRAIIEVPSPADAQPVSCPPGVAIEWLARDRSAARYGSLLVQRLSKLDLADGPGQVFVAGEAAAVRMIREDLARRAPHARVEAKGYWRFGEADHREPD